MTPDSGSRTGSGSGTDTGSDTGSDTVLHVGGASPYDVVVGHDLASRLPAVLGDDVTRVALVHDPAVGDAVARVAAVLGEAYEVTSLPVPPGEQAKTATVAAGLWEALGEAGLTRSDAVVTVGGGATTDLGGFVAATWLRGVRVVHVPTTLLAMVDAAVGGKTGINTGAGKNLVGSFHEPAGVLCDLALLATLPRPELVAGLGEVVKCGFIADPAILDLLDADPSPSADGATMRELVERSVRVKVDVVVGDLRETGSASVGGGVGRELLNYGHTMAHAVERVTGYGVRHGEAVAIGSVYVAELSARAGVLPVAVVQRHRDAFAGVGLPVTIPPGLAFDDLLAAMRIDKKSRGNLLRFVVLDDVARPRILEGPDEQHLRAAYEAVSA